MYIYIYALGLRNSGSRPVRTCDKRMCKNNCFLHLESARSTRPFLQSFSGPSLSQPPQCHRELQ